MRSAQPTRPAHPHRRNDSRRTSHDIRFPTAAGLTERPVVPSSPQQAQDTVLGYLKKTLRALPSGTTLDATRYSGGTNTASRQDVETGTPPGNFTTIGELRRPAGTSPDIVMAAPQLGYPASLQGISPCFPGNLLNDRSPFPVVLKAD